MGKEEIKANQEYTKEQLIGWEKYRDSLYIRQEKSHDLFEKAITFISSGTLGLTIALHDNIVPVENVQHIFLIAIGWLSLSATLFINLISHYLSSKSTDKTIDEIDMILDHDLSFDKMNKNLNKRNKLIDHLNIITVVTLGVGLLLVITYVTLNIYNGKAKEPETTTEIRKPAETQNEHTGAKRAIDSSTFSSIK